MSFVEKSGVVTVKGDNLANDIQIAQNPNGHIAIEVVGQASFASRGVVNQVKVYSYKGPDRITTAGPVQAKLVIDAGYGNDVIDVSSSSGPNVLRGGADHDVIFGGIGNDDINGGSGNDTSKGGPGRDKIVDTSGYDAVYGGADPDYLNVRDCRGGDTVGWEAGIDVVYRDVARNKIDFLVADHTVQPSMPNGWTNTNGHVGGALVGSTVTGNGSNLTVTQGNFTWTFQVVDAYITGTPQNDSLYLPNVTFPVTFIGGAGNDVFVGGAGNDTFDGGLGNDTFTGNGGSDTFLAQDGVPQNDLFTDFTDGTDAFLRDPSPALTVVDRQEGTNGWLLQAPSVSIFQVSSPNSLFAYNPILGGTNFGLHLVNTTYIHVVVPELDTDFVIDPVFRAQIEAAGCVFVIEEVGTMPTNPLLG